jgi:hypothetical protein
MAVSLRIGRWIERTRSSSGAMWITSEAATFHRQCFHDAFCFYYDHSRSRLTEAPHRESTSEPPLSSAVNTETLETRCALQHPKAAKTRSSQTLKGSIRMCDNTISCTGVGARRTLQLRYAVTTYRDNDQLERCFQFH